MPLPLRLGNDQVQALADGFGGRVAEDDLGAPVPELDAAIWVGDDDSFGRVVHEAAVHARGRLKLSHRSSAESASG